jgi:hypothetical protein
MHWGFFAKLGIIAPAGFGGTAFLADLSDICHISLRDNDEPNLPFRPWELPTFQALKSRAAVAAGYGKLCRHGVSFGNAVDFCCWLQKRKKGKRNLAPGMRDMGMRQTGGR